MTKSAKVVKKVKVNIPKKSKDMVKKVKGNKGRKINGYQGGIEFKNREKLLPGKLKYKEYDINIYKKGINRGKQRIVIENNGRAWYTPDHHKTFFEIK